MSHGVDVSVKVRELRKIGTQLEGVSVLMPAHDPHGGDPQEVRGIAPGTYDAGKLIYYIADMLE